MTSQKIKILCVDDEPNVLEGLKRQLYSTYDVTTAQSGASGLEIIKSQGPFAVVVSDMRMPHMDGATFLKNVKDEAPDIVRLLLTGQTDLDSAIRAVNDGHIFRFLTKPCSQETMNSALKAASDQYRLITAEKVLLEDTLQGSIKTLTEILAIANPEAFTRTNRITHYVTKLISVLNIEEKWAIQISGMLSQIGSMTLPPQTITKIFQGDLLTGEEQSMVDRIPQVVDDLLANIPRLEPVRQILIYAGKNFDGTGLPKDSIKESAIPMGARIIKIVRDFVMLESRGHPASYALDIMVNQKGYYDSAVLKTFSALFGSITHQKIQDLSIKALRPGMVLSESIQMNNGNILVGEGTEITLVLLERIKNFSLSIGIKEPIRIKGE